VAAFEEHLGDEGNQDAAKLLITPLLQPHVPIMKKKKMMMMNVRVWYPGEAARPE
jgi:hypothetical protein